MLAAGFPDAPMVRGDEPDASDAISFVARAARQIAKSSIVPLNGSPPPVLMLPMTAAAPPPLAIGPESVTLQRMVPSIQMALRPEMLS